MENITLSGINWLAVATAVVASMVIGFVWYSKALFAKQWTALMGKTEEQLRKDAGPGYAIAIICSIIEAVFLAILVSKFEATDAISGAVVGLCIWIGLIAPVSLVTATFSQTRKKLWAINYGYHLVNIVVMSAILAAWPK